MFLRRIKIKIGNKEPPQEFCRPGPSGRKPGFVRLHLLHRSGGAGTGNEPNQQMSWLIVPLNQSRKSIPLSTTDLWRRGTGRGGPVQEVPQKDTPRPALSRQP
jgi:hypothetical protein